MSKPDGMTVVDPHMVRRYLLSRLVGEGLAACLERFLVRHGRRPPVMYLKKR